MEVLQLLLVVNNLLIYIKVMDINEKLLRHLEWIIDRSKGVRATFCCTNINDTNFSNVNLMRANFMFASLIRSDFSGSDLRQSNFRQTDLRDAKFTNADLRGANF